MSSISAPEYLALGLSSFLLVGILTPLMRKIALRTSFLDNPNSPHKSHAEPVPYLGGVAIIIGVLAVTYLALLIRGNSQQVSLVSALMVPAFLLGVVGFIDDKISLPPFPRFLAQSLAGIFTAVLMINSDSVGNPTGNTSLDALITVFWVVGVTNSINFFDNVDGGAAGTVAAIALGIFGISFFNGQIYIAAISIVLTGAMFGFLLWNKSPARIYMGDAGALFLGVIIAALTVRLDPDVASQAISLSIPLILLAIPILDTTVAVLSRLRRKISPFQGGQDHLSHRLMRVGLTKRKGVFILWGLSGVSSAISLFLAHMDQISNLVVVTFASTWVFMLVCFLLVRDSDS